MEAFKNAKIYKEKTKRYDDRKIGRKDFYVGPKVLLFNSRLRHFPRKLNSRWSGLYKITQILPNGVIDIVKTGNPHFRVNGKTLKLYYKGGEMISSIEFKDP